MAEKFLTISFKKVNCIQSFVDTIIICLSYNSRWIAFLKKNRAIR